MLSLRLPRVRRAPALAVAGVATIALALGAGCDGSSDPEEPTATATASTATPTVAATETATPAPTTISTPTATATTAPAPSAADVVYAEPSQESAKAWSLDVYLPATTDLPPGAPAVVILPGAGSTKATASFQDLAQSIADLGATVLVADFRTGSAPQMFRVDNAAPLREATEAAARAVRFARASTGRVIVVGQSAGGFLGLWAALVGDDVTEVWDEVATSRGSPLAQLSCSSAAGSARPDAFVGYAGAYNIMELVKSEDPELAAVLTPDTYIGVNLDVTIRLIQGTTDSVIPAALKQQHEALTQTLADAGYDATWTTIAAGHYLDPTVHEALLAALAPLLE